MKKIKRYVRIILLLALAVGLTGSLYQIFDERNAAAANAEAAQIAGLTEPDQTGDNHSIPPEVLSSPKDEPSPAEEPEPLPEEASHLAELDLAALQAVNEDVVGWIEIPGTELSYPLVQGTDNRFYLSHNWKRESSGAGAVFLEQTNSRDLSGFHLIAYAHRMHNDTMFGTLKYYSDLDFFRQHPSIYLVDGTAVWRYDIFAAHKADVKGLVYRLDLEESGLEDEFIRFCLDSSVIDTGVVPEPGAQILTLSTCTEWGHTARWVVQGVLVRQYGMAG